MSGLIKSKSTWADRVPGAPPSTEAHEADRTNTECDQNGPSDSQQDDPDEPPSEENKDISKTELEEDNEQELSRDADSAAHEEHLGTKTNTSAE